MMTNPPTHKVEKHEAPLNRTALELAFGASEHERAPRAERRRREPEDDISSVPSLSLHCFLPLHQSYGNGVGTCQPERTKKCGARGGGDRRQAWTTEAAI